MMPQASVCIVAGSGPDLYKDLETATRCAPRHDVLGVNLTSLYLGRVRHMASLHAPLLGPLRELRTQIDWCAPQGATPPVTHGHIEFAGVDRVWTGWDKSGTSSLFGVRVALALGYERVILAGVPMTGEPRFFDPPHAPITWDHANDRPPWMLAATQEFAGRVTSVSGWTRELLGSPEEG